MRRWRRRGSEGHRLERVAAVPQSPRQRATSRSSSTRSRSRASSFEPEALGAAGHAAGRGQEEDRRSRSSAAVVREHQGSGAEAGAGRDPRDAALPEVQGRQAQREGAVDRGAPGAARCGSAAPATRSTRSRCACSAATRCCSTMPPRREGVGRARHEGTQGQGRAVQPRVVGVLAPHAEQERRGARRGQGREALRQAAGARVRHGVGEVAQRRRCRRVDRRSSRR